MAGVIMSVPKTGTAGLEPGTRTGGRRTDFDPKDFVFEIETKGPRFAWLRAAECPCVPINDQTDQPDPTCPICKRRGIFWFGPESYAVDPARVGVLDAVQAKARGEGAVIRGILGSITYREPVDHKLGRVTLGETMVTVRPENRLGYGDRLVNLDAVVAYRERIVLDDPTVPIQTRYPVISVNLIATLTGEGAARKVRRYTLDDFDLVDGELRWRAGRAPVAATHITVHYQTHPTYVVIEHPNVYRVSLAAFRRQIDKLQTPLGDVVELPLRAKVHLEFVPRNDIPSTQTGA